MQFYNTFLYFFVRPTDKESTRGSSDSSRDKEHHSIESLKEKMEGIVDVRGDKEEKSRTAKFSTSSWADQVDDEDNYENYQKGLTTTSSKPVKEERTVPKRVYIQQRKVENMTTAVKVRYIICADAIWSIFTIIHFYVVVV